MLSACGDVTADGDAWARLAADEAVAAAAAAAGEVPEADAGAATGVASAAEADAVVVVVRESLSDAGVAEAPMFVLEAWT
jgi:hypothetical protein